MKLKRETLTTELTGRRIAAFKKAGARGGATKYMWLLLFCGAAITLGSAPAWYVESFIHTHHSTGKPGPEWEQQFEAVRPDAVQFHVLPGRGGWPQSSVLSAPEERVFEMKEMAERHNIRFVMTASRSGQIRDLWPLVEALPEEEQQLFHQRVTPDGQSAGRFHLHHLCYHSPGIERHIFPSYRELIDRFGPDQIWIDHTVVTVNLCYCEVCRAGFAAQHGQPPPDEADDLLWDEWVTWHRAGFEQWMRRVHDLDPDTLMTFNHAYFLPQPEPPPSYVRNLSADIHSDSTALSLFARYASTLGLPFDLMTGLTDRWAGTVPKTMDEVLQAAAVVTANGGRWHIGEFPMSHGRQPVEAMLDVASATADFVRERQAWTHHTEPVPVVAVLQSASTQYARVIPRQGVEMKTRWSNPALSRIYWYNNQSIPREVLGAGAALKERHVPFDLINEETLKERLQEYQLLVVPDQFRLDAETVSAIRNYGAQGGAVLVTGRRIDNDLREALADLGHIHIVEEDFFTEIAARSPYVQTRTSCDAYREEMDRMEVWLRELVPDPIFSCKAPPWMEVALRQKGEQLLVHLVERTFDWRNDLYHSVEPVVIRMTMEQRPQEVRLQPGDHELDWTWHDGRFEARIPLLAIKTHAIVEVVR